MQPGTLVAGKYRVERVIGRGGMGLVVEATNTGLGSRVALKFLAEEMATDQTALARFRREAQAAAQLKSEHICRVFDVGVEGKTPFIVMELLGGTDLARLSKVRTLDVPTAALYIKQACLGLAEAHAARIVHRDLKPGNLFITRRADGSALIKILDFGVAKAPEEGDVKLTGTSNVVGSPGFVRGPCSRDVTRGPARRFYGPAVRFAALVTLLAACHGAAALGGDAATSDGMTDAPAAPTSTLSAETASNTSASPLFADDYHNYNASAQTGNGNGDLVLRGSISKLPLPAPRVFVETQTWFCHLTSNEAGERLVPDARCGSHIDVGYNSDDPAQVARQVADLRSRGIAGAIMDWSGKDTTHDADPGYYPTANGTDHAHARSSGEVATNAIYAMQAAAEAGQGFQFAVMEDEGITNCRKGWAGGCACWPAYGATCNETSQVISDLSYIAAHWASSPAYLRIDGEPVVLFFAPDYNACPNAADCHPIDWNAVHQFVGDQVWIFENKGAFAHAFSGGGFAWLATSSYPGSDATFGLGYLRDYDQFALAHAAPGQHVLASAFKGFDDAVTDGWNFGDGSHTRYIEQRCGKTWLDTLAQIGSDFASGPEILQLVTWDDYEEATELETGIDSCIDSIDGEVSGDQLAWSIHFGVDLTGGVTGSEDAIDHVVVWASPDGEQLVRVAPDLVRDASGALPHTLDLAAYPPPPGTRMLFVQAVARPFLANGMSPPIPR